MLGQKGNILLEAQTIATTTTYLNCNYNTEAKQIANKQSNIEL